MCLVTLIETQLIKIQVYQSGDRVNVAAKVVDYTL